MKRAFMFILLAVAAPPVFAAETWTEVHSKNFTLVGNAGEQQIRTVAANLEQFRAAFSKLFPRAQQDSTVGTTVILFRNNATFEPYKPRFNGKPVDAAGYFQEGADVNFVAMTLGDNAPRVIYHEYAHLLTRDSAGLAPAWFREGIAEYYSTFTVDAKAKKLRLGAPIREHLEQLRQNGVMALPALFSVDHGSPAYNERDKQSAFYATSWAVVHYLMLGEGGKRQDQLLRFLRDLADGLPALQSFQTAFGVDTGVFQKNLEAYIRNQATWPTRETSLDELPSIASAMTARTLSEAEGEYFLGNLLLHSDRLNEAETTLQKAIMLDSKLAAAQGAMGALRIKQARYKDAMEYLKRAEDLDPRNYLVHYYIAVSMNAEANLTKTRPSDDQLGVMQAELMKAIDLAPFFVEASELLARVNLIRNEDLAETAQALRKSLDLSPGRDSLVLMLATVLAQIQDGESPRPLLQQLVDNTSTEASIKKDARNLLEYLDRPLEQIETLDLADIVAQDKDKEVQQDAPLPEPPTRDGLGINEVLEPLNAIKPAVQGEKVEGVLTSIDCAGGMTLSIKTNGGGVKLHSDMPSQIQFVSYTSTVTNTIACGPTPGAGIPVSVTYRSEASGDVVGVPLVVEFTGK